MPAKTTTATTTATHPQTPEPDQLTPGTIVPLNPGVPQSFLEDAESFAGAGTSDRSEDSVLPYLYIVQKGSPQVNKREPEYIEGCEVGNILNTATRQLYGDEGIEVVPAYLMRKEVEWVPRSAGGGYVATHEVDTPLLQKIREVEKPTGKGVIRLLPNGNQLVSTAYHFVVPVDTLDVCVVALTSTGLQVSRRWNALMRSHKVRGPRGPVILPSFSHRYRLRTVYNSNESGDWFSYAVDDLGLVTEEQLSAYHVARAFYIEAQQHGVTMGRPPVSDAQTDTVESHAADDDDLPI